MTRAITRARQVYRGAALLLASIVLLALVVAKQERPVHAQPGTGTFSTIADITGTGASVAVASSGSARWCQLTAPSTNSADVRWGDSNVGAARGAGIAAGGGQMTPYQAQLYQLASLYVYVANGDKVRVTCGQ